MAADRRSAPMLEQLKIKSAFVDGLRVTDADTVEIVEMVLAGSINKQIILSSFARAASAVGLGKGRRNLIESPNSAPSQARSRLQHREIILDLGFVGEPLPHQYGNYSST